MKKLKKIFVSILTLSLIMTVGGASSVFASTTDKTTQTAVQQNVRPTLQPSPEPRGITTSFGVYYYDSKGNPVSPTSNYFYWLSDAFNSVWSTSNSWKGVITRDSRYTASLNDSGNIRGVVLSLEKEYIPINIDFDVAYYQLSNGGGNRNNVNYVKGVQQALLWLGYNIGTSGIDGDFGPSTENAIIAFQRSRGISADGVVGKMTYVCLASNLRK